MARLWCRACAVLATLVGGCGIGGKGASIEVFSSPPPLEIAYVSPDGGDLSEGTEDAPFASLRRALRSERGTVVLLPGRFPEPKVIIDRPVTVMASPAGRAVLEGHLFITASDVRISGLEITAGLSAHLARGLRVENATIAAGRSEDALSLVRTEARLSALQLECGRQTCLQATTATISGSNLRGRASGATKRVVRIETSSATLSGLALSGGGIAQLQAGADSALTVSSSTLSDSAGNGLAVVRGAKVRARRLTVRGARRFAVLVQRAEASLIEARLGSTPDLTVGVAGGALRLRDSTIDASTRAAISLSGNGRRPAQVVLEGGIVRQLDRDGVLVSDGTLTVRGTRFEGDGDPGEGPGDAIVAHGGGARLDVQGATFHRPRGFAVLLGADATATITATISEPGEGGVSVSDVAVETVRLHGVVITGCRAGSGVVAQGGSRVDVRGGRVSGCPTAGYLAGSNSEMDIDGASATDNGGYGFAAFGGSVVRLEDAQARGSRWGIFASCGAGARVERRGDVSISGRSTECP